MKKAQLVGLIGTGSLTDSPLTRFWWLSERLGPVKSASYRVASRIANMLQAGHPVKDYAEFESCVLILVCVPEETVPQVVSELVSAGISWRGKAVVLCSTWLDSGDLRELSARGASVGSISPIPGFDDRALSGGGRPSGNPPGQEPGGVSRAAGRSYRAVSQAVLPGHAHLHRRPCCLPCSAWRSNRCSSPLFRRVFRRHCWTGRSSRTLRSFLKGGRRAYPTPRELPRQLRALGAIRNWQLPGTELPSGVAADGEARAV